MDTVCGRDDIRWFRVDPKVPPPMLGTPANDATSGSLGDIRGLHLEALMIGAMLALTYAQVILRLFA